MDGSMSAKAIALPFDEDAMLAGLMAWAAAGFDISAQSAGGGSDGNFTGAMGIPTLDGLGIAGAMMHTLEEHILVDSIVPRAKLLAGLLTAALV